MEQCRRGWGNKGGYMENIVVSTQMLHGMYDFDRTGYLVLVTHLGLQLFYGVSG